MTKHKRFFEDKGLCFSGGAIVYGYNHGVLRWAPMWLKHTICHLWNRTHCAIKGHDQLSYDAFTQHVIPGAPKCGYCCAPLKIDGRYPTPEEVEAHNEICYKGWEEAEAKWRVEHPEDAAEYDRLQAEMGVEIEKRLVENE